MSYLTWFVDKVVGNFLWWIILLVAGFIYTRTRAWWKAAGRWVVGLFRKQDRLTAAATIFKKPTLDTVGVWFLVAALILLALWNQKLKHDTHLLEVEMVRYVLPRELSKDQVETFGKYLASHSQPHEVRIRYILGDTESQRYAEYLALAFSAGNWPPDVESVNPAVISCQVKPPENTPLCSSELEQMANLEGVSVSQTGPNPPPPSTVEEKLHPPSPLNVIVSEALKAADISTVGNGYSENNDPINTITVFVGLRPRDKWAVIPTNFSKRQKTPQDITDDDF